jgi:hypothetical protein
MTRVSPLALEQPIRLAHAWLGGGAELGETREAFARLREFLADPDWRTSPTAQRRP